jgi:hypothetical protein
MLTNANQGIHDRIKRIYEDRGGVWQHRIAKGFDILDSDGHTILPEDWNETVEPGMVVSIKLRHRRTSERTIQERPSGELTLSIQDRGNAVGGTPQEEILPASTSGAKESTRHQTEELNRSFHLPLSKPRLPPPPPPVGPRAPLTSATYIPDGASFGPGVGIPPLVTTSENNTAPAGAGPGNEASAKLKRPEPTKDGLSLLHIETGRPRRSAVPTFCDLEADPSPYAPASTLTPEAKDARRLERKYNKEKWERVSEYDAVDELLKEWTTVF